MDVFDILYWLGGLKDLIPDTGSRSTRTVRTVLAALALLAGVWLPAMAMDAGQKEAAATLAAMFLCSPAALVLAYPVGYLAEWLAEALARAAGMQPSRWVSDTVGPVVFGVGIGAAPWFVLFYGCALVPYVSAGHC